MKIKFNREVRRYMAARESGLSLTQLIILNMLKKSPMYNREMADLAGGATSLATTLARMEARGLVLQDYRPERLGSQGRPNSAIWYLSTKGEHLLNSL